MIIKYLRPIYLMGFVTGMGLIQLLLFIIKFMKNLLNLIQGFDHYSTTFDDFFKRLFWDKTQIPIRMRY